MATQQITRQPNPTPSSAPNLLSLINRQVGGDEDATRNFFQIKRKPSNAWMETLMPGVDASQRVLDMYFEEMKQSSLTPDENKLHEERSATLDLAHEIFGESALDAMRKLSSSIKSKMELKFGVAESKDGDRRLVFRSSVPKAIEEPETKEPLKEPEEGLIPGNRTPATSLDALVQAMRPRVRLDPEGPQGVEEILAAVSRGEWTRRVAMLLPIYDKVSPHWVYSIAAQVRKQPWLGVHYETETVIQRARNVLAQKFLASEAEWSFWLDSDVIAPFADPGFFYDTNRLGADPTFLKIDATGVMAVERLMKAQKTIVGGVYQMRKMHDATIVSPIAITPRDAADRNLVLELQHKGPVDRVVQVPWIATGCALIHRRVYVDIMQRFPERQPKDAKQPYDFFGHDVGAGGEDAFFCDLAQKAGHASHLDCGLWAAHLGAAAYFPTRK